jgi:hypothetical protein
MRKAIKIVVIGFIGLSIIGAIAGSGGKSKSPSTQPASVAPAVTNAAPPAEQPTPSAGNTNACHGVPSAACDEQISREGAEAEAVLKHRQAEQTANNLEQLAQAQGESE